MRTKSTKREIKIHKSTLTSAMQRTSIADTDQSKDALKVHSDLHNKSMETNIAKAGMCNRATKATAIKGEGQGERQRNDEPTNTSEIQSVFIYYGRHH